MPRSVISNVALTSLVGAVTVIAGAGQDRSNLVLVVAAAFVAGAAVVWLWREDVLTVAEVLAYAVVFRLLLFPLPPSLSDDSYRYVWDGVATVNGLNPYGYTPDATELSTLRTDIVYSRLNSQSWHSVYPPVSQYIFAIGAILHKHGWIYSHFGIKALFVILELLAVFLIARMVQARWVLLYALNPIVLVETAGQAHTESALVLLLVLTILWARKGNGRLASVALACAAWVKLYPFVLFPFLWRRFRWDGLWPGMVAAVLLALPFAAPHVVGNVLGSLKLYSSFFEFNAGLYYTAKKAFLIITGADWSKWLGPALRYCFIASLPFLYYLDGKYRWSLVKAFLMTIGCYLVLSTTVHPWYLVGIIVLAVLLQIGAWHWHWLGLLSLGTYLMYVGGPYWPFVILGWGGWLALVCWRHGPSVLQQVLRYRAWRKWRFVQPFFPRPPSPLVILDLGAGEGYVGERIRQGLGAHVTACDVIDLNRTTVPHVLYDGRKLPWEDAHYDVVILYFVLHHSADQEAVLREALRVASGRVIVVEAVYEREVNRRIMRFADIWANRLRSRGRMTEQEDALHFRTNEGWTRFFAANGASIMAQITRGRCFYRQTLFVLDHANVE